MRAARTRSAHERFESTYREGMGSKVICLLPLQKEFNVRLRGGLSDVQHIDVVASGHPKCACR